jgi:pentatricopeptide repeat protein
MSNNRRQKEPPKTPRGGIALIRLLVRTGDYDYTEKVWELMEEGWFCEEDIERCIDTGVVCKKQKDEMGNAADGWKYTILGSDCAGAPFYCAGKIMRGEEGKLFLVITAHERTRS